MQRSRGGVAEELGGVDPDRVAGRRDQLLLALLQPKAGGDRLP